MNHLGRLSIIVITLALAGCSIQATVIPAAGPLAQSGAAPFKANIHDVQNFSGSLDAVLPTGEKVIGEWQAINTGMGTRQVFATARGNRGTVFELDAQTDSAARGIGKGKDNRGNIYRVMLKGIY
jgi:hypothetical protein